MSARFLRILPALWLLVLLSVPGVLYALGSRQAHPAENPYAEVPSLASIDAVSDAKTYSSLEKVVLDRLPLREHALEVRAGLAMGLLSSSPVPDSRYGKDGWLYLRMETRSCDGSAPPSTDFADAARVVADTLEATGRTGGVLVSGSKLFGEPEHRPWFDPAALRCQAAMERAVRARLAGSPLGLDLTPALARIRASGNHTFLKYDTHWNGLAREQFVRAMLDRIRPGYAGEANVRLGPAIDRKGDLAQTMEISRTDRDPTVLMDPVAKPPAPGSVVLIGDSQSKFTFVSPIGVDPSAFTAGPLTGQSWCELLAVTSATCDPYLPAAKVVLIQASARHAREFTDLCGRVVSLVGQGLRGRRLDFRGGATARLPLTGKPMTFSVSGGDDPSRTRVLRVPITKREAGDLGIAPHAGGKPLPCPTPMGLATDALLIPIPAGVALRDVRVAITGPAGSILGAPELVELER